MRINEVKNNEITATLTANELVILGNVLYFYEQHHMEYPDSGNTSPAFHELFAQTIIGRDLCQYGHLDGFTLSSIIQHKIAANPESRLVQTVEDLAKYYPKKLVEQEGGGQG